VDYGLGTRLGVLEGRALWGHTGGHAGIIAVVTRHPDEDVSIAVLSITVRSETNALVLEGEIAAALFGIPTDVPPTVAPVERRQFAGRYVGEATEAPHTITADANALVVAHEGGVQRFLLPIGNTTFVRRDDPYPLDLYVFHLVGGAASGYSAYDNGFHGAYYRRVPAAGE
jgi:hypothetical protein